MSDNHNAIPEVVPFPLLKQNDNNNYDNNDDIDSHNGPENIIDEDEVDQIIQLDDNDTKPNDLSDSDYDQEEEDNHNQDDPDKDDDKLQPEPLVDDSTLTSKFSADSVYSISRYSNYILQGDGNNMAYLWNSLDGSLLHKLEGHTDSVVSTGFSFDGNFMATGSMDSTVKIYKVSTGELLHTLTGPSSEIEFIIFHPKGNVIVAGSADSTTWMWNVSNGSLMNVFSGPSGSVVTGTFSFDGKLLITGSEDGSLFIFSPKTATVKYHLKQLHNGSITCVANHPNQPIIATGGTDGIAKLINIDTNKVIATFIHSKQDPTSNKNSSNNNNNNNEDDFSETNISIEAIGFSQSHKLLATGGVDGKLKVWDLSTSSLRCTCQHQDAITNIYFDSHQPIIVSGSMDGTVKVWDARSGKCLKTFQGHQQGIISLAVKQIQSTGEPNLNQNNSNNSNQSTLDAQFPLLSIVTGSDDHTVKIFIFNPNEKYQDPISD